MWKKGLTYKTTILFSIFIFWVLVISSLLSYFTQSRIYKEQCKQNITNIAISLEKLMEAEKMDTIAYHRFFMAHHDEMEIPTDFTEYESYKNKFFNHFSARYPGKTFNVDITTDELDFELQKEYFTYRHIYWTIVFEESRKIFGVYTTYFISPPADKPLCMTYIIDAIREGKEDNKNLINLGITVEEPLNLYPMMWETWSLGKPSSTYDIFNNHLGHTYAYYTPLIIDDYKIGVIGAEIEVKKVNTDILSRVLVQMSIIGGLLIIMTILLIIIINKAVIKKIALFSDNIESYSMNKNKEIGEQLTKNIKGTDEIDLLMWQFAEMIFNLDLYMENLRKTTQDLEDSKKRTCEMSELAIKDALTGIRNKTAYDREVQKINWEIDSGHTEIGAAMIDLNFLKRINDTYGHDKGNIAIIKLCKLVCNIFEHSPVFRIGGDEFLVILKGHDLQNIKKLKTDFDEQINKIQNDETLDYWERTSAALGYAIFDPKIDNSFENIFKRADKDMYANKKAMKAVRSE